MAGSPSNSSTRSRRYSISAPRRLPGPSAWGASCAASITCSRIAFTPTRPAIRAGSARIARSRESRAPRRWERETRERMVDPLEPALSGFVFKIQANMDPAHRDRIAFLRLCSGKYTRGMRLYHVRLGKEVRVADALTFMASDRAAAEEAYAGDIIGLHNHGTINIGDTFTEGERLSFTGVPNFP